MFALTKSPGRMCDRQTAMTAASAPTVSTWCVELVLWWLTGYIPTFGSEAWDQK